MDVRRTREWRKDDMLLSTDPELVPIQDLTAIFALKEFYWAKPMPEAEMRTMLQNSMVFAVYDEAAKTESHKLVGFARCVTDFVTIAYLTDVWVQPSYQGKGVGGWLISCVNEVLEPMPHLRRTLVFTADWKRSVPFYEKWMSVEPLDSTPGKGLALMEKKGKGHPTYGRTGTAYE